MSLPLHKSATAGVVARGGAGVVLSDTADSRGGVGGERCINLASQQQNYLSMGTSKTKGFSFKKYTSRHRCIDDYMLDNIDNFMLCKVTLGVLKRRPLN